MLRRLCEQLLIRPEDIPPSRDDLEVVGTFNPGVIEAEDHFVLLVRVAERPRERRSGFTALPRCLPGEGLSIDWVHDDQLERLDPRVVRRRHDGLIRLTFISHLVVTRSRDGRTIDDVTGSRFLPEAAWEEFGVEDPRIVHINDKFYITYVAVSSHGAATALASTHDFVSFERHGIIFCPENKDVALFPGQIDGRYVALHRPNAATQFTKPEMWIASSPDLFHWGKHKPLGGGASTWETDRIGGGAPPLHTAQGWLEIYHGSQTADGLGKVGVYSAGALLLDSQDPSRILGRSADTLIVPQTDYERNGFVPNVIFPTGVIQRDDTLLIYYGAADTYTALIEVSRSEVMTALQT